jgi:hypothetical protein
MRNANGTFVPAGNPSERPKVAVELRALAAEYTEKAILTIVTVMQMTKLRQVSV